MEENARDDAKPLDSREDDAPAADAASGEECEPASEQPKQQEAETSLPEKKRSVSRRSFIASAICTGALVAVAGAMTAISRCGAEEVSRNAIALKAGEEAAAENSALLQKAIDEASAAKGAVELPAGTFFFAWTKASGDGNYVIEMRDGVEIRGAGREATILKPFGRYALTGEAPHGIDMFYYDGLDEGTYLTGATFRDFTIDGESTQGSLRGYNASGKGFFFKLFKDCLWENVEVRNTDGTGFGADFPIDCTMRDCVAVGCGKNATASSVGASGFGVGIGYSESESILIENCESSCNTKFGFFFEHQSLFAASDMTAKASDGFSVTGCKAWGNLVNFGGNRAYDVAYANCESDASQDSYTDSYTDFAFRFINHSVRIVVENAQVDQMYSDMLAGSSHLPAVEWALSSNVAHVGSGENDSFRPDDSITRGETAVFLWRYAGRPGDVAMGYETFSDPALDVGADDYCADAVRWLKADGLSTGTTFRPSDTITIGEFALLLWRYALLFGSESSQAVRALRYSRDAAPQWDVSPAPSAKEEQQAALDWALREGIVVEADTSRAKSSCTRAEAMEMLYALDCAKKAAGA